MSCRFPDSAPGGGDWSAAGRACGFCGGGECHIPGPVAAGCRNNRSYDSTERSLSRRIGVVVSVCCAGATSRGRRAEGLTRAPAIESETADIGRFLGTDTVAELYRARWQIELFFKWIKQHLRIKRFFGTSANAVQTQLWIAISVYVLVAIVRKRPEIERDLYTLLQILSVHLFEKAPLAQVLAGPDYTLDDTHVRNQSRLFDF